MTVEKPKPRQLLWPITTGTGNAMNQSQFLLITCNSLEARQKSRVHGAIGFGFDSRWLKNWCESFKPITKRSNRNHVITFDSHLKTALIDWNNKLVSCALDEVFFLPDQPRETTDLFLQLCRPRDNLTTNFRL